MNKGKWAIILTALILAVASSDSVLGQSSGLIAKAERITGDKFQYRTVTPNGATVLSVKEPSKSMLVAIDQGLADLFTVARKNRYRRHLSYGDYTIFIAKADRQKNADGNYSPDIAVGAAQYSGTVYDQGGYIFAAGMVISNNPSAFVIAEHTKEMNRVSDVVRYEGEHLVLYFNDRRRYERTKDHSQGGSHPILQ